MLTNDLYFWLLPVIFGVYACAFVAVARVMRQLEAPRWAIACFVSSFVGALLAAKAFGFPKWFGFFALLLHWISMYCALNAFLVRHQRRLKKRIVSLLFGSAITTQVFVVYFLQDTVIQVLITNAVVMIVLVMGIVPIFQTAKTGLDRTIFALFSGVLACYVARSVAFIVLKQWVGPGASAYIQEYLTLFFFSSAIIGLCVGSLLILTCGYDFAALHRQENELDALTGLGNRRALDAIVDRHLAYQQRVGAILVADLDHFKRINDVHGHDVGDRVLVGTSHVLQRHVSTMGEVVRMGGEEFIIILWEHHQQQAERFAMLLRTAIGTMDIPVGDTTISVTGSFGVAWLRQDEDIMTAIRRADGAMYRAKQEGRNRVCVEGQPRTKVTHLTTQESRQLSASRPQ